MATADEQQIVGTPASKWDWEAALLERSVREGLAPTAQHIALVISTFADGDGTNIRPTTARIQMVSGRGRATVFDALRELRSRGWIRQVRRGAGAAKRASEYRLTIPPKVQQEAPHQTKY
jgi:predicted transcriptional regulator